MLRTELKVIRGNPSKRRVPKFAPQGIARSACLDRRDAVKAVALRGTRCAAGPADRYDREAVGSVGCRQRRARACCGGVRRKCQVDKTKDGNTINNDPYPSIAIGSVSS